MAPSTTKAIVIKSKGNAAIETVNTPKLRDGYLLVKTTAVGLNPTDWKHIDFLFGGNPTGARVGCDYAGVVEEVGSKVTKSFKKGDRVAGVAHGSNQSEHEDGTFAEYIVVKADVAIKIPDNLTDEEGATLGIGVTTVGQGLYQTLELPLPDKPASTAFPVLIYGGSSATGILGIQFAKVSGLTVVTTASPRNFDYLKSLGADHCFDYKSPTCAEDIKKATGGRLQYAWDCISDPESAKLCIAAMSEEGGRYACLLPVPDEIVQEVNPKVQKSMTWAYTVFGEEFEKSEKFSIIKKDLEFGKMFWELARHLLAEGKVKAARQRVNQGGKGLEGVMVGLKELKEGKHSGEKYVYTF